MVVETEVSLEARAYTPKSESTKFEGDAVKFGSLAAIVKTSRTELAVAATGSNCTENKCKSAGGCATCVTVEVGVPGTAQILAIRYYSTAQYTPSNPNDYPTPRQIAPNSDHAWAFMEAAQQKSSPTGKIIYAKYFNRSHNRDRRAALEVDWSE